jgi:nitrite reductase (NADH) small subunit
MTGLHRVGSLAKLRSGVPMKALVEGRAIAVFALGDDVIATNGRCPHAKGPLHEGEIEGEKLICPWHGWTYNLRTGACDEDPDLTLERFEVSIEGDDIMVRL